MALIDCPECPRCHFPNPLAEHPSGRSRALTKRRSQDLQVAPDWDTDEEAGRWQPPAAPPEYRPPQPQPRRPEPPPKQSETITAYEVVTEPQHDNSLAGLFHGKTNFWFALCVYFLGGTFALAIITAVIGKPEFMMLGVGSWAFVSLFLLF